VQQTLPYEWYVDPETLRREQEQIFLRSWQYAGHLGQLADTASYFTANVGFTPVVVTRSGDGELRAFLNVCRHRGFLVATGEGRRETLQCGYHGWTYDLGGALRTAPRSDVEPGFDKESLGLVPAAVGTWGPFVFVNPSADAPPLADALGSIPAQVAELLDVDALEFNRRAESTLEANWKVVCENFLECYHCQIAHPSFARAVDTSLEAYRLQTDGLVATQRSGIRQEVTSEYDGRGELENGQFHLLWPNTAVNVLHGRPNLTIGPINPAGPTRTERFLDYFFAPGEDPEWIEQFVEFDNQVGREDRALVEGVQRGVAAGALAQGYVLERSEVLIRHFQELTSRALR
jgi:choline monooxygenase